MILITSLLIFSPIVVSIIMFLFNRKIVNYLAYFVQVVNVIILYRLTSIVIDKGNFSFVYGGYLKSVGIQVYGDIYSILFLWMTIIGFSYALIYIYDDKFVDVKFILFMLFLEGVMNGIFLVNDIFTIFVLIELATIISSILIIYQKDANAVKSGIFYLLYNTIAMILYLLGVVFIYKNTGYLNIQMIGESLSSIYNNEVLMGIGLIITALSLKSALFPVYSWLPYAHSSAPSSVSALLSGLVVKIGIFGFIRILGVFHNLHFQNLFLILGIITSVSGVLFAMLQYDIKRILAFSTISQVGLITISITSRNELGFWGGIIHITNHFLTKGILFLCAGVIIYMTGERNIKKISGFAKNSAIVSIGLVVGVLSITGAPFFLGSVSKYLIKAGEYPFDIKPLIYMINIGTTVSFYKIIKIFTNKDSGENSLNRYRKTSSKKISIIFLMLIMLGVYYLEVTYIKTYLGVNIISSYIVIKTLGEYVLYILIAVFVYKIIISKEFYYLKKVDNFNIGFQSSNLLLIVYLIVLLSILKYSIV